MSRNAKFVSRVAPLILLDMFLAAACLLAAYIVRFHTTIESPRLFIEALRSDRWFQPYISIIIAAPFVRAFMYNLFGVYDDRNLDRPTAANLLSISKAVTTASVVLVFIAFAYRSVSQFP